MKNKYSLVLIIIIVVAILSITYLKQPPSISGQPNVDELIANAPDGWNGRSGYAVTSRLEPCTSKPFTNKIYFTYPAAVCEIDIKTGGKLEVSPKVVIYYYEKFSNDEWDDYDSCRTKATTRAYLIPEDLIETGKYTIMMNLVNTCPEKDNSEIIEYVREYYSS